MCDTCVAVRGIDMIGLANEVVQFLLARLPGIDTHQLHQSQSCSYQQIYKTGLPVMATEPECLLVIHFHFFVTCIYFKRIAADVTFHWINNTKIENVASRPSPPSCVISGHQVKAVNKKLPPSHSCHP